MNSGINIQLNMAECLLDTLGYSRHLSGAQKGNHESLIQFLVQYKDNMTAELKAEIIGKGIGEALIDDIINKAESVIDADVTQENLKEESKTHTEEAQKEFNAIYEQIIGICKICHQLFKEDKLKAEHFSFSHILENMSPSGRSKSEEVEE